MKLSVDADITRKLARALCERGYGVLSAHEAGNADASDLEQMAFAVTENHALLTCNSGDFTAIFEDYWYADRTHNGVIVSEQLELGEMIRRIARLLDTVDADDMRNNWKTWPNSLPETYLRRPWKPMKHVTRLKAIREVETLPPPAPPLLRSSAPPLLRPHYSPITLTNTRFLRRPSNSP